MEGTPNSKIIFGCLMLTASGVAFFDLFLLSLIAFARKASSTFPQFVSPKLFHPFCSAINVVKCNLS